MNSNSNNKNRIYKELMENIYNQELNSKNLFLESNELIPTFFLNEQTNQLKIIFEKKDIDIAESLNSFYNSLQNSNDLSNRISLIEVTINKEIIKKIKDKYLDIVTIKNNYRVSSYNKNSNNEYKKIVALKAFDEIILDSLRDKLEIYINKKKANVFDEDLKTEYKLEKKNKEYIFSNNLNLKKIQGIIGTKKYLYIIYDSNIYKCTKEFINNEFVILMEFIINYENKIYLNEAEFSSFIYLIMPKIEEKLTIQNIDEKEINALKPKKVQPLLYLDFNYIGDVVAKLKFKYDDIEFDPLSESPKIRRNTLEEAKIMKRIKDAGFLLDNENSLFLIKENNKIYKFITETIEEFLKIFKIYSTENFDKKKSKASSKISLGIKIENNLLNIDLENIDINKEELKEVLQKYKIKKKYHRLKDGTFINLENNEEIEFINNLITGMDISYKELENGYISLPLSRSFYLDKLLKSNKNVNFNTDNEYRRIVDEINLTNEVEIDNNIDNLKAKLRDYQIVGYKWMRILDSYKFGGILADDMGLGKTIQVLSVILNYVNKSKNHKTSIVITPSSLALNWKSEIEKFTPSIKAIVINGNALERKNKIKKLEEYDVIITSYELLKRDIEIYSELNYEFKFVIADEAQYIKNNSTQNARAIKRIIGETKYALTGTPIENSLNELWSIFDFIMPGYLFSYKKFKNNYEIPIIKEENSEVFEKLKMIIQPFVLRRTKDQVLKELPNKTNIILNNEMTEEQNKVYMSYLVQARGELQDEIDLKGFEHSRIKILALLTRLRQICCHPSLFISNYKDGSGKLEQCIELIKTGIQSGHKILLFSGYTSMFEIIEKEIKKEKIDYLKLTGSTKVSDRLDLIDKFNRDDNTKLFLISLKAGGTGINLTSADMVIHYDPWWNLAVENQATDRTHRIGQTKKVQVYKLITKNSIEEKIYELQKRKEKLIDNMLSTDIRFINNLSKEDIMSLFE